MAAALWNRRGHGRRVFHPYRPIDGSVFHGSGCRRLVQSLELAECAVGGGLRRLTHYFWSRHCEEIWWLNQERIVVNVPRATNAISEPPRRRGRRKIRRRIWIA